MIFINTSTNSTGLFKPLFPISIPYGIGSLISVLRENDINASFVDQQIYKNVLPKISEIVNNHSKPYIFCISTLTEAYSEAVKLSYKLKKLYPDCIIILGGIHPTAVAEEVLNEIEACDYVFIGEGELQIVNIYNKLKSGNHIEDIPGIAYRKDFQVVINPADEVVNDINLLPEFPYDIFIPFSQYNFSHIISSRGCPYNCTFCCVNFVGKRRYRYKNTENTVKELEFLVKDLKQKHIAFFDDNLLANKKRIIELCEAIGKSKILKDVTYSFQARVRDMNEDVLKLMFNTGFNTVFLGIETVSPEILKNIGKTEMPDEISLAIRKLKEIGFKVMANFIFCFPDESREIRINCVEFSIKHDLDLVKFNNVVPYPGTVLYNQNKDKITVKKYYSNFNSQEVLVRPFYKKPNFPLLPENTSEYQIRNDILFSYFKYYFRFRQIKKIFSQKAWGDLILSTGDSFFSKVKKIPAIIILGIDIFIKFVIMFLSVFKRDGVRIKEILKVFREFFK